MFDTCRSVADLETDLGGSDRRSAESSLPAGLDSREPGPELAALLSTVDVDQLSPGDRVVVLRAYQRMASHMQAKVYQTMTAILGAYRNLLADDTVDDPEFVHQAAAAEVGSALRLTRRTATREMATAADLFVRLPQVGDALTQGRIDQRRARVLISETAHLTQTAARTVVDQIIRRAETLTTGQLAARLRRLTIEAAPEEAEQRFQHAAADRRMVIEPTCEGTADILLIGVSPDAAMEASHHVDSLARRLKTLPGELRTLDQIRADIAVDLLRGRTTHLQQAPNPKPGRVEIRVDLTTLAELDQHPGELAGYGPVIADIARNVALRSQSWSYVVTHPQTGEVVHTGTTRRRPNTAQARRIRARHATCVFPGCRIPATRCDLDHRRPYSQGGPTSPENLAPLCRHHHVIRHRAGWQYQPIPEGGYRWTSPLGHTYLSGLPPP
jgi:hypothetical protein